MREKELNCDLYLVVVILDVLLLKQINDRFYEYNCKILFFIFLFSYVNVEIEIFEKYILEVGYFMQMMNFIEVVMNDIVLCVDY